MAADVDNIYSSPASVLIDDADIGHTQGGVEVNVAPKNRIRNVDIYGDGAVAVVHLGDDVKVSAPLAEYTAATLQQAHGPGNDQTGAATNKYMGMGRKAGFIYPDVDVKIVPTISAQAAHKVHLYKAVAIGTLQMKFAASDDKIMKVEWQATIDESKDDGQLLGTLMLAGTVQ